VFTDGGVGDVVATSGPAILASAAVTAIRTWRFSPAACAEGPVNSVEDASIPFVIRGP
jgi:hypothetical protein